MNPEIEQLTTAIKQATDYQINKTILREKIQTDLHFTYAGGLFKATPELISFIHAWNDVMYIEDTYGNPIEIVDSADFIKLAKQHYHQVMNDWHQEHAQLRKLRKI
jgi:hypothetical protein